MQHFVSPGLDPMGLLHKLSLHIQSCFPSPPSSIPLNALKICSREFGRPQEHRNEVEGLQGNEKNARICLANGSFASKFRGSNPLSFCYPYNNPVR